MEKWKKAIIHLECVADSVDYSDVSNIPEYIELHKILTDDFNSSKITQLDFRLKEISLQSQFRKSRDKRFHGTAIFLTNEDKYYLITARHVVFDKISADRYKDKRLKEIQENYDSSLDTVSAEIFKQRELESLCNSDLENTIFNIIFRVSSLDELQKTGNNIVRSHLMNLGAGGYRRGAYTFSEPDIDVAVISLNDGFTRRFADEMLLIGYVPITLDDINEEPSAEGAEVFTAGFPGGLATWLNQNQDVAENFWNSGYFSLPNFTFGRISMLHESLSFFWTDMSIYPGNSGGPIIENNKLVGIVSGQPTIPVEKLDEKSPDYEFRIPFGNIIKAKNVLDLFRVHQERESWFEKINSELI